MSGIGIDTYHFSITLLGATVLCFVLWTLKRAEKRSIRKLGNRFPEEGAVNGPLAYHEGLQPTSAVSQVNMRFAFIRRLLCSTLLLLWLLLAVLPGFNRLPAAMVSFALGTLTLIIGIAARPFIENVIAGIVLAVGQPIRLGDTVVIDDHYGTVEGFTATYVCIRLWDSRRYVVPNHKLLQKEFLNHTLRDAERWAYVEFYVSPHSDLALVESLAKQAVRSSAHWSPKSEEDEPSFWIIDMARDSVQCWVAGWTVNPSAAWGLTHDVRKGLLTGFRAHGIETHKVFYDSAAQLVSVLKS